MTLAPVWKTTSKFFYREGTLIDDMAFSYFYHSTLPNQVLHFTTITLILPAVLHLLAALHPIVAVAVLCLYLFLTLFHFEFKLAAFLSLYLVLSVVLSTRLLLNDDPLFAAFTTASYVVLLVLPAAQFGGHVQFEGRRPAFRAFEALFTTPVLMLLLFVGLFGFYGDVIREIKQRSVRLGQ